jgi:hypothetical protein
MSADRAVRQAVARHAIGDWVRAHPAPQAEGPQPPTRADLDAATAATAAVLADPEASPMDRYHAAEAEAAIYEAAADELVAQAEAETEAEMEL